MIDIVIEDLADLRAAVLAGETDFSRYGDVTTRERGDLLLFNYTVKAQEAGRWNWFERVSRGLIVNRLTGDVVARPFDKFFNWGEAGRTTNAPMVSVAEKMDGSLGILYWENGLPRIATRGSFDGDQALWATDYLQRHHDLTDLDPHWTLLFEIIYPENRIVVDYGGRAELVLLGARDAETGWYPHELHVDRWGRRFGFARPRTYNAQNVDAILALLPELNANEEGFVATFADGQRFKFKGDAYLTLHRLISGLSFKAVLEAHQAGTLDDLFSRIPDEFLGQAKAWREQIDDAIVQTVGAVALIMRQAPHGADRKVFAQWAQTNHAANRHYLFAALDGYDLLPYIYKDLRKRGVEAYT